NTVIQSGEINSPYRSVISLTNSLKSNLTALAATLIRTKRIGLPVVFSASTLWLNPQYLF
ncbi:MAG: hypothetical protein WBM86_03940, partial [Waterburya sp.]